MNQNPSQPPVLRCENCKLKPARYSGLCSVCVDRLEQRMRKLSGVRCPACDGIGVL